MHSTSSRRRRPGLVIIAVAYVALATIAASTSAAVRVTWMPGFAAPGTPANLNTVGVVKVGPRNARNVLVLEPGTLAGGGYFVPLATWVVANARGWQVWSVENRENLLEDQSVLNLAKAGQATPQELFDYYLGFLADPSITQHFRLIPDSSVAFARQWGLRVTVEDLHRVIEAAKRQGRRVVLGGHSRGGAVVTAYATWDFNGRAGADDLAGLVYIDGGTGPTPVTVQDASRHSSRSRAARPGWRSAASPRPWPASSTRRARRAR